MTPTRSCTPALARRRTPAALAGLALLALGAAGCQTYAGEVPVIARAGDESSHRADQRRPPVERGVPGSDWAITSVLFFPTFAAPRLSDALADAERNAGGGNAVSARVSTLNFWVGMSVSSIRVEADVAQTPAAPEGPGRVLAALADKRQPLAPALEGDGELVTGVVGEDTVHQILWVPTQPSPPHLEDAIHRALAMGNGDILVDADVEYSWWSVPLLYGFERWRVRGDVIDSPWLRPIH